MCILRVRATSSPDGDTRIAVLKPKPSAPGAFSYSEACTKMPLARAASAASAKVGPPVRSSAVSPGFGPAGVSAEALLSEILDVPDQPDDGEYVTGARSEHSAN